MSELAMTNTPVDLPDPLLEPTVSLERAARILGIGRTLAYELARTGRFPVPLLKCGNRYRVPTASLLDALGLGGHVGG
jgi:Helix-turn-helix domain